MKGGQRQKVQSSYEPKGILAGSPMSQVIRVGRTLPTLPFQIKGVTTLSYVEHQTRKQILTIQHFYSHSNIKHPRKHTHTNHIRCIILLGKQEHSVHQTQVLPTLYDPLTKSSIIHEKKCV